MKRLLANESGIATFLVVVLVVLGVVIVGVVVAGVVILGDGLKITVTNQGCGTVDIAQGSAALGFNFLPGINVPSEIAQGETVEVQVPRRFVDSVTIGVGSVEVTAFGRSFTFGTSAIDMQLSTLNGSPLVGLVGSQVDLSGDHTLVLVCQ